MRILKVSAEEADAILASDKEIDRGKAQPFDLSKEQEKIGAKFAHTGTRKKTVYDFSKRERKPNETKQDFIKWAQGVMTSQGYNARITNPDRQIAFSIGDADFELTLVQKRKKKE